MLPGIQSQSAISLGAGGGSAEFIGGVSSGQALATTRTVSLPAGSLEGDLAVVIVNCLDAKTRTLPSGFTSVFSTATNFGFHVGYKHLDATDISNGSLSSVNASTANMNMGLCVFRGLSFVSFAERYDANAYDIETPSISHTTGNHYLGIAASKSFSTGIAYTTMTANYSRGTASIGSSGQYAQHVIDYQFSYPSTEMANVEWDETGRNADLSGSRCLIMELEDAA